MWADRKTYDDLRLSEANQRGVAATLKEEVISLRATLDWMRVRLTQLEHERAVLISNYMGITVTAPRFEKAPQKSDFNHPLQSMPSFEDVGDEEASRLGVGHNPDGTLHYTTK